MSGVQRTGTGGSHLSSAAEKKRARNAAIPQKVPFGPFSKAEVEGAFHAFDLDGNSYVSAAELRQVFLSLGEDVTDREIDEMISMVDGDGDGVASKGEFVKMIFKYAERLESEDEEEDKVQEQYSSDESNGWGDAQAAEAKRQHALVANKSAQERRKELQQAIQQMNLSSGDMEELKQKFAEVDADHSGNIDFGEFCQLFNSEPGPVMQRMFSLFDHDGTGGIDLREFLVGIASFLNVNSEDRIKFAFHMFDEDNSGQISKTELVKILKANYMESSDAVIKRKADAIMRQADRDGNGSINFAEFQNVCKRFPNLLFPVYAAHTQMNDVLRNPTFRKVQSSQQINKP